ncbi:sodium:phosphate symporter [Gordoniibacillus kamchatkensis]|uniref:Sodium:phosphate symporter n=1 Tax=Gordoniibacillus kamchatkensis TaxID=1590651 RepID=A0ABR5ABS1_9BACL|nr:Na/Pi symporter [Paenibacillus sp. VKM B-2647]KIL38288.1 sodium:phosphate symporter [Paenibacillus sp. VKM B-2647]
MLMTIILPVMAGLSIFLFGMKLMESALHAWAGPYLKRTLEMFTKTPLRGLIAGTALTAVLQSSTAVTVITIGLVNAGVLSFAGTLGVILGTNIGSCLSTELIGLGLGRTGVPMLLAASIVWLATWIPAADTRRWALSLRWASLAVAGFALVLLGVEMMQTIGGPLRERGLFAWFVSASQQSLLWGVLAGACVTALVHSSAATIALTMSLASVQAISVELGIAIVLGANIGTCVTALIASIGGSRAGRYVAWTHVLLNVGGAALFFPLIGLLFHLTTLLSADEAGQIARFQTVFNIICSLLALPLCYLNKWKNLEFRS